MSNAEKRLIFAAALSLAALAAPVRATDLLANPGFEKDLSGWTVTNSGAITAKWSSVDAFGVPGSGSVAVTGDRSGRFAVSQCFALTQGVLYTLSAQVLLATGQASDTFAAASVIYYTSSDCSTGPQGGNFMSKVITAGVWAPSSGGFSLQPSVHSVAIEPAVFSASSSGPVSASFDNFYLAPVGGPCAKDASTLCLNSNRFRVRAHYTTDSASGDGMAVALTGDTGYFTFFDPNNVEIVIKVLDACAPPFNQFWVFASGLTNVGVELDVEDPATFRSHVYLNPRGTAFQPLQDTAAFPCP